MWITLKKPYIWRVIQESFWMFGLILLAQPAFSVERIGRTYSQIIHRISLLLIKSTSWRFQKPPPIYGGISAVQFQVQTGLLHSEWYLSTDYRDLSTNLAIGKPIWGISLPPRYRRCFIQKTHIWASTET